MTINRSALPESLLESDLFGHARGAYTGGHSDRIGKQIVDNIAKRYA